MDRDKEQVETVAVTITSIMRRPGFHRGVEEVRTGCSPDFDLDDWDYERGRLFGTLAPISMPLKIDGKLNPKAVALYKAARKRGLIPA